MTEIVGEMIGLVSLVSSDDAIRLLTKEDGGSRLFAYVYFYAHPERNVLRQLVKSVTEIETQPFGQYWGIQAISRVIQITDEVTDTQIKKSLRCLLKSLPNDTDRYYELSRVIDSLESSS